MANYKFDMGVKSLWLEEILESDCRSNVVPRNSELVSMHTPRDISVAPLD